MILIISIESDRSTSDVINWVRKFKKTYIRLNEDDYIIDVTMINGSIKIRTVTNKCFDIKDITGYWYRRGGLNYFIENNQATRESDVNNEIIKFKKREVSKIINYLYSKFDTVKNSVSSYQLVDPNKLSILETAKDVRLIVPETIIATDKQTITDFFEKNIDCITKPISEIIFFNVGSMVYKSLTTQIYKDDISLLSDDINFPTLVQNKIHKKYEIRIFYFHTKCYPMAIFSQNNSQTLSDFRN